MELRPSVSPPKKTVKPKPTPQSEKEKGVFAKPPPPAEPPVAAPPVTVETSKETREMKRELLWRMGADIRKVIKPILMVADISLDAVKDEDKKKHLEAVQDQIQGELDSIPIDELRELQTIRPREKEEKLKPIKEDLESVWEDIQKDLQEELFDVIPATLQKIIGKKPEEKSKVPEKKPEAIKPAPERKKVGPEALAEEILKSKKQEIVDARKSIESFYKLISGSKEKEVPILHSFFEEMRAHNVPEPRGREHLIPRNVLLGAMQNRILREIFSKPKRELKEIVTIILTNELIEKDKEGWKKEEKYEMGEQKVINANRKLKNSILHHAKKYILEQAEKAPDIESLTDLIEKENELQPLINDLEEIRKLIAKKGKIMEIGLTPEGFESLGSFQERIKELESSNDPLAKTASKHEMIREYIKKAMKLKPSLFEKWDPKTSPKKVVRFLTVEWSMLLDKLKK